MLQQGALGESAQPSTRQGSVILNLLTATLSTLLGLIRGAQSGVGLIERAQSRVGLIKPFGLHRPTAIIST